MFSIKMVFWTTCVLFHMQVGETGTGGCKIRKEGTYVRVSMGAFTYIRMCM